MHCSAGESMARLWSMIDGEPWMTNPARLGILGAFNPRRGPGRGKKFLFHGAFGSKRKAREREKQIPGSFIVDKAGEHFVVTRKNHRSSIPNRSTGMASAMQRRMAYVRSFQRNRRRRRHSYALNPRRRHYRMNRRRHYRRNPYPMGGTVAALAGNPRRRRRHYYRMNMRRRHYRRNPGRASRILSTSYFGLPSLETVGWSVVGFSGTAAIQSMLWGSSAGGGLIPASWATNADGTESKLAKYGVLLGSVFLTHTLVRMFRPH